MDIWLTNPLEDVFRTTKKPSRGYHNRRKDPAIEIAQNARESIQIAVHTPDATMLNATAEIIPQEGQPENGVTFECGGVRLIHNSCQSINIREKVKRADLPGELPQMISPEPMKIQYGQSGSFFITANTAKDARPGVYEYTIRIHYGTGKLCKMKYEDTPLQVKVYPVCLPDPEKSNYNYLNWINFAGFSPECDYLRMVQTNADTYGIETFSDEWFELIKNYAVMMRKEHINVVTVPLHPLLGHAIKYDEKGDYIFDFTLLDRFLDTFLEWGGVKYFCGFHLMNKVGIMVGLEPEDNPEFPLTAAIFKEGHGYDDFAWVYMNDDRAWHHLEMLIKGLYNHLKERGLEKMWLQHISDEVAGEEAFNTVKKVYQLVHEWAPEFRTVDATWETSLEKYGEDLNIHVPQIDIHDLNQEQYAEALQKMNVEVWSYTCLKPQFEYLSRLDDWKLICTRMIHWYNFKNNLTGYLHWSWNLWHYGKPFEDGCTGGWPLDGWVVLPDVEHLDVFETIRQRANASGIEDYELLKICDQIDHEKTQLLVSMVIDRANDYTMDTDLFFRVRRQLLEIASSGKQ